MGSGGSVILRENRDISFMFLDPQKQVAIGKIPRAFAQRQEKGRLGVWCLSLELLHFGGREAGMSQTKLDSNTRLFAYPGSHLGTKDSIFCFPNKASTSLSVCISGCFFCSPSVIPLGQEAPVWAGAIDLLTHTA